VQELASGKPGMSVATVTSSIGSNLLAVSSAGAPSVSLPDPTSSNTSNATPDDGRGAATTVQLSDHVKAILTRAEIDQSLAARLQTLVQARRAGDSQSPQANAASQPDVDQEFQQLTGGTAASDAQTPEPVQVVRSFDTGLKADGYTISAMASDQTGSSRIEIVGPNGFSFLDEHFGWSDEFVGGSSAGPGSSESEYQAGNVEYITIAQGAAASSSTTTSSSAGSTSTSSTAEQALTTTIAVDFTTGQISIAQAATTQAAGQISQQTPSFSTIA
jgi:hypothetical protein